MNKSVVIVIAIMLIAIVGGGGFLLTKKSNTSDNTTTSASKSTEAGPVAAGGTTRQTSTTSNNAVSIENFAFSTANITVKKGTTITWTNKDSAVHTVTENDGQNGPASGNLAEGKTYSYTYDTVGTFKYHCAIHSSMAGSVTVTE